MDAPDARPQSRLARRARSTSSSTRSPPAGEDYRRLVERLPAIVYASELGEHGRWRYVSPQVEEILGYTPEEWIADPGLWAQPAAPRRPRAGARAGDRKTTRRPQPAAGRLPDDHPRRATSSGSSTRRCSSPTTTGVPVWHGVLYDITERKSAEQELQRAARPAGGRRPARRAGAAGRRPGGADGARRSR